jgi:cytochrome P450
MASVTSLSVGSNAKAIPIVRGLPILGSAVRIGKDFTGFLSSLAQAGDVSGFFIGKTLNVLVNRPEYAQFVLSDLDEVAGKGDQMKRAFPGQGLYVSEGDLHRRQRKLIAPIFHSRHFSGYAQVITERVEHLQKNWRYGDVIDLNGQMIELYTNINGALCFGDLEFSSRRELARALVIRLAQARRALSLLGSLSLKWPAPGNRQTRRALRIIQDTLHSLIADRQKTPEKYSDLLAALVQARDEAGNAMSAAQIVAECVSLYTTSYAIVPAALSWVWYLLCTHPEIYRRVQREGKERLVGRTPVLADLEQLPYSLQVIKEALRLYTPVLGYGRVTTRDLEMGGYRIPQGARLLISPFTLHRRADVFPEPESFDPERFSLEREKLLPPHAYIPFGDGPRACIARHFALTQLHLIVVTLAQRVTFDLVAGQHLAPTPSSYLALTPGKTACVSIKRNEEGDHRGKPFLS